MRHATMCRLKLCLWRAAAQSLARGCPKQAHGAPRVVLGNLAVVCMRNGDYRRQKRLALVEICNKDVHRACAELNQLWHLGLQERS